MKFLEEYADRQALIWKIFSKHQNILDEISHLHLNIDDFKGNIQKEFNFLKEVTCKNIKNFQASLSLQQTYLAALGSHINNIYHKISELQQQLPHPTQHMNTGDIIQINAPEFDLDIDHLQRNMGKYRGQIILYNIMWKKLRKVKPLHYHNKSKKKWIDRTQNQSRSQLNQPRITTITYQ